ncbi:MAG TPA: ABC transporter ATP-binding protein [Acidimicrobiales bacterium]|nr:ABC transporter ATP-binding protein [Acidimicrobiales bacterium]
MSDEPDEPREQIAQTRAVIPPGPAGRMALAGMPVERSENFGASTKRLLGRMRPERAGAVTVIFLAVCAVSMAVLGPKILGKATDIVFDGVRGVDGRDGIDFGALHRVLFFAAGLYIASSALQWLQSYILAGVVQRTMRRLRSDVEDKLNRLPLRYVDRQARGDLLSRVTNDIDNLAQSMQQTLSMALTSILQLVGVLVMMIVISWLLALIALVTIPLSLLIVRVITSRSRKRFMAQWRHTGTLNAHVEEVFTGHSLVKAFGRQADVERDFDTENEALYNASFGAQFISGTIQPAMMFLGNLNYVSIAVIGGLRVSSGALSLGDVQAFIQYSRQFSMPLTQLASMANVLQSGVASAERVFELLDAPEEIADIDEPHEPRQARGHVEFDHVYFSYQAERPLIEDLSLVAEPGRTVAIVGPTGAGKTTLVNLLMRFYEVDAGQIRLDGRDIASMPRRELRSHMGMVLQDAWLFGGTIRENIAYGNLKATDDDLIAAAKATYVDRFVHSLPDGYDTIIDDEGSNVSAGERQLITIARAFLADPTILILDEATSSVDTRTEVLIQRAMAALRSQRTSFVIAHRLSTIRDADTILVMDAGRIVEQGNHQELLARGGAYFTLYNSQFTAPVADVA